MTVVAITATANTCRFVGADLIDGTVILQRFARDFAHLALRLHLALHLPDCLLPAREQVVKDVGDARLICCKYRMPQGCDMVASAGNQATMREAVDRVTVDVHAIPRFPPSISAQAPDLGLGELRKEGSCRNRL